MFARSPMIGLPFTSRPNAIGIDPLALRHSSDASISRKYTVVRDVFGTSIPTVPFPGTGARYAPSPRASPSQCCSTTTKSFPHARPLRDTIQTASPWAPWSRHPIRHRSQILATSRAALSPASSNHPSHRACRQGGGSSKSSAGNRYSSPDAAVTLPKTVAAGFSRFGLGATGVAPAASDSAEVDVCR